MPNINVLKSSRFLKKEDCNPPVLLTIKGCTEENMAKEGAPEELRWCLHFAETDKPMVLNSTNGQIIAGFIGNDNTDNWIGHKVVLYFDPNVSFGGKLIGGIRARAPRVPQSIQAAQAPAPQPTPPPASNGRRRLDETTFRQRLRRTKFPFDMPVFRGHLNDYDRMPIGKWKGELLMDVPHGYFRWLREQDWLMELPVPLKYVLERDWGDEDEPDEHDCEQDNHGDKD